MRLPHFSLLLCAALVVIATSRDQALQRPSQEQESDEIRGLTALARSAPAEFAADVLIRLAQSTKITNVVLRRELLEEAFRRAADAQQPFRRTLSYGNLDSREAYLAYALDLQLDILSLRTRAVRAMLPLDKGRARELFNEVPATLSIKPLDCRSALIYNFSDYYATLAMLADKSFMESEKVENEHIHFLEPYIAGMVSPAQVGPMARLIASLELSPAQLAAVIPQFAAALRHTSQDDRSFSASLLHSSLGDDLERLVAQVEKKGLPPEPLIEAVRAYFLRNLNASRCADNLDVRPPTRINNHSVISTQKESDNSASEDLIRSANVGPSREMHEYWKSPQSKELLTKFRQVRFRSGAAYTPTEKESNEWQQRLDRYLIDLKYWGGQQELEADYLHEKSILYMGLLDVVPRGPRWDDVLTDYISFLRDDSLRSGSRIEWFWHANRLIEYARESKGEERRNLLLAVRDSGDYILRLYAELERLVPAKQNEKSAGSD